MSDIILHNGKITTLDPTYPEVSAISIQDGVVTAIGSDDQILADAAADVEKIDLQGRRVIPGLNDSHLHVIRAGLFYNLELRWDGVPSVSQALGMLKAQVAVTPPPQWIRVIGGWNEFQFKEGRMPNLDEINQIAPDTPVFLLHLYDSALLNKAALRALGYDRNTPNPPGGLIARDKYGDPTGLFLAEPNALVLYSTISKAPVLSFEDQLNSSRHYMRELNRFGVTSVSDAGGGGQNYPDDYRVINQLRENDEMTLRIAYSLFAQSPGTELDDYTRWTDLTSPGDGDDYLRVNGAGENLVWSAADFENFLQPRPDLAPTMEADLEAVMRRLAEKRWPWRIHATYDESIDRFLNIFEKIHSDSPIDKLNWFFDHAETISDRNLDRIEALGGGIAVQHRMAYQGEYYIRRYGAESVKTRPPIKKFLERGLPVGGGTDGTRVASYHPWTSLWWMVTSRTVGGTVLNDAADRLSREQALTVWTKGSAWFSRENDKKGTLSVGYFGDLAVLNKDYFAIEENEIRDLESVLTVLGGKIVYGSGDFNALCPELPPVSPSWSPAATYNGYHQHDHTTDCGSGNCGHDHSEDGPHVHQYMGADGRVWGESCGCWL